MSKHRRNRILSAVLSAALVLSLSTTALAAVSSLAPSSAVS